jgi:D-serine deaminase-like pyridoxal phosphate-dependent protein
MQRLPDPSTAPRRALETSRVRVPPAASTRSAKGGAPPRSHAPPAKNPRYPPRVPADDWSRYRDAIRGEPLPTAIVDLDALAANVDTLVRAAQGKPLRIATKSIRCPEILRCICEHAKGALRGLMTYTAAETAYLADQGYDDLLLAYPTLHPLDLAVIARANARAHAAIVVDSADQLPPLDDAARKAGTRVPVVVDLDVSYRPIGALHIGVRRSPLHSAHDVVALATRIGDFAHLAFAGIMAYEAQIAGVSDGPLTSAMKALSRIDVADKRAEVLRAIEGAGLRAPLFNGGGTGSLASSARDPTLTEVTAGSGFLDSHLFDAYRGLALRPAAFFALQAVRAPAPGIVTCQGGGYVASGRAGKDRLPIPWLPRGLSLLPLEGAGEVQTPVVVPTPAAVRVGDPVFFRHAKAGELAEHFREYLLVREDKVTSRAPTYRGLGLCFLG